MVPRDGTKTIAEAEEQEPGSKLGQSSGIGEVMVV